MNETRYPLCWPEGWKRTTTRRRAQFGQASMTRTRSDGSTYRAGRGRLSIADALARIEDELYALGYAGEVLVSTNLQLRLDGLPRSGMVEPGDPGAAVYWHGKGKRQSMAIDTYDRVADNLAAIAATLNAMRAIERHGGAQILERAFIGFAQLPASTKRPWREVLGFGVDFAAGSINAEAVQQRYRGLAKIFHSDLGGADEAMIELNAARDQALREVEAL